MKSIKLQGTVLAMVAVLAQLVLASHTNTTSKDSKDILIEPHRRYRIVDESVIEDIEIFVNAANEFINWQRSTNNNCSGKNYEYFTTPSWIKEKTATIPKKDVNDSINNRSSDENFFTTPSWTMSEIATEPEEGLLDLVQKNNPSLAAQMHIIKMSECRCDVLRRQEGEVFLWAVEELQKGTNVDYYFAIKEIYNKNTKNLKLLLLFGDALQDIGQKREMFDAIFRELESIGHTDSKTLSELTKHIKTSMLDRATGSMTKEGQSLLDSICTLDIIPNLLSDNLALVKERLLMGNDDTFVFVIGQMYCYGWDGFELVMRFANFVQEPEVKLKIYKNLYSVMSFRDNSNMEDTSILVENMLQLTYCIKTQVLDQVTGAAATTALTLLNKCANHIMKHSESRQFILAAPRYFDLLLNLTDSMPDAVAKFNFYDALYKATKNMPYPSHALDILIPLHSSMKSLLDVHLKNYNPARNLLNAMKVAIVDQVAPSISSSFIENKTSSIAQELSSKILNADFHLLFSVYDAVIKKISDELTIDEIFTRESCCVNQLIERMALHEAITNQLQRVGNLSNSETIVLARRIKQVQNNSAYEADIPQYWRSRYEELKNKLSSSVRNMVFSSKVCIKNINYKEYLYVAEEIFERDQRRVCTVPLENIKNVTSSHRWMIQFKYDFVVYIQNEKFSEYMFMHTSRPFTFTDRFVLASRTEQYYYSEWFPKTDEHGVYMTSFDQVYLCAGLLEPTHLRRYASTFSDNYKTRHIAKSSLENCKWEIVDCS